MITQQAIERFYKRSDLSRIEMLTVMRKIMRGEVNPYLIGGFLTALQVKGPSVEEVAAAAEVMREFSVKVKVADSKKLIDTCGTGGDGANTFNISTASAFVVAAAGGRVAKHGGRSVSSSSGSADVLEALGARIDLTPERVALCVDRVGIGFMFAPDYHAAMKYAAPVRRELGVKTLFNVLGPLTNPAGATHQVMGVYSRELLIQQAMVLKQLGSERAVIVHAENGLDEVSPAGKTYIAELRDGEVDEYVVSASDLGVTEIDMDAIKVEGVNQASEMFLEAIEGTHEAAKIAVALNAGASIYAQGLKASLKEAVAHSLELIATGAAKRSFNEFVDFTIS